MITESGATLCGIKPGDKPMGGCSTVLSPSGAAGAVAVHMDGGIEKFADRMNEEARKLGATGTHFVNPHGLNDEKPLYDRVRSVSDFQ